MKLFVGVLSLVLCSFGFAAASSSFYICPASIDANSHTITLSPVKSAGAKLIGTPNTSVSSRMGFVAASAIPGENITCAYVSTTDNDADIVSVVFLISSSATCAVEGGPFHNECDNSDPVSCVISCDSV